MSQIFVVKIGGSILSTESNAFDFDEAKKLRDFFLSLGSDSQFVLITGGGYVAREYQKMLRDKGFSDYDQHYAGTVVCNLNAVMLRSVFGSLAEDNVVAMGDLNLENPIKFEKKFLIAGAGKPGPSSDWDATWMAKRTGATSVVTLKDIDGVYSEDPDKNPNATRLAKVSWNEYMNIIGNPEAHKPGGNLPVDPIAARLAKENGLRFYVVAGNDFDNLKKVFSAHSYIGTEIS